MATRISSHRTSAPRLSGRDYAIMKKVAQEAIDSFKDEIPAMVESTVANMLERIGINVATPDARSGLRARFVGFAQSEDNRRLISNRAIGTLTTVLVTACLSGLFGGTVLWFAGIHLVPVQNLIPPLMGH